MDLFTACLVALNEAIDERARAGLSDSYFLLEAFRTDGAPLQRVKALHASYSQDASNALPTSDAGEIVGLLLYTLRVEHTCIYDDDAAVQALVELGQRALELAEIKTATATARKIVDDPNDDALNTTEQLPATSSSSDEEEEERDDGGKEEEDEEERDMRLQVEARRALSLDDLVLAISGLSAKNIERAHALCRLLHFCATHANLSHEEEAGGGELDDHFFNLALFFAPMLCKPERTAYLSIRHSKQIPAIRLVLWVWMEHFFEVCDALQEQACSSSSPRIMRGGANNAGNFPSPVLLAGAGSKALFPSQTGAHKPRLSASSLPEVITSMSNNKPAAAAATVVKKRVSKPRRNISAADLENAICNSAVIHAMLFPAPSNLVQDERTLAVWLDLESGADLLPAPATPAPPAPREPARWANEQRLEIEKRILKKRLLQWDRDFEQREARKPSKEDRLAVKGVFTAYAAVKLLLQAVKGEGGVVHTVDELEALEKKALQAVLKLFERDFAEKMQRKVEFATDIAGREMEYTRYKELKERVKM